MTSLTHKLFYGSTGAAAASADRAGAEKLTADEIRAARAEGERLARIDLGMPPRLDSLPGGLNGGFKAGPPPVAPTARETAQAHNGFVLDLLRGAQNAERSDF